MWPNRLHRAIRSALRWNCTFISSLECGDGRALGLSKSATVEYPGVVIRDFDKLERDCKNRFESYVMYIEIISNTHT